MFVFATCYFRSFIFPNIPILPSGDQLGFLESGSRIVAGQMPYRDYFQIVPPGTDLTYALLIRAFGLRTWIPGLTMATLAATTGLLITRISMRVVRGWSVALPAMFVLAFLLPEAMDATHHWFSTVLALAAVLVLLGGLTPSRIVAAGALCGLTASFTQTKGAAILAGFAVFLICRARWSGVPVRDALRQGAVLGVMATGTFVIANAHFISAAGVSRWFYCIIVYPLHYYPAPALNNWRVLTYEFGEHHDLLKWAAFPFVYAMVPMASVALLFATRRRWKVSHESCQGLVLIALTGIFMFLVIAPSPSIKRMGSVGPLDMVCLAWFLSRPGRIPTLLRLALSLGAIGLALVLPVRTQTHWRAFLDLPAGRTAFFDQSQYDEYTWVLHHTQPGQFFFRVPMYVPLHLVNPAPFDALDTSEYTRPEQVAALVQSLETHSVPLMILPSGTKYPRATGLPSDHLGSFWDYLCRNYRLTQTFATGDEVWEKKSTPTNCDYQVVNDQ